MKIAVVYYSGTGNTEQMADALKAALAAKGSVDVFTSADFDAATTADYDALALGCPAMGDEVLEEGEFEPLFADMEGALSGKKVILFGSYGWGDGQWMRDWVERTEGDGATVVANVICQDAPDDTAIADLEAAAAAL